MNQFGFARVTVCSPICAVGNPNANIESIMGMIDRFHDSDVIVFPELCVTGYTCADLFRQTTLLDASDRAILRLARHTSGRKQLIFVGAPVRVGNELFNCALALHHGSLIGIVPKQNIPNYNEFYESRWFRAADGDERTSIFFGGLGLAPFGINLLFECDELVVHAEICEDLWMPIPPSSYAAIAGANLLVNLSASNETVAKNAYRMELVKNQSGRCIAAYAYASAGPTESTTDLVFGGHCLIAENGNLIGQTVRTGTYLQPARCLVGDATGDIDVEKLCNERRLTTSFGDTARSNQKEYRRIRITMNNNMERLRRFVPANPFVSRDETVLHERCSQIFDIQCAGLAKRIETANISEAYIGVSGGLDSTLALLVAAKTFLMLGKDTKNIKAITMPGFGTTERTRDNAMRLMNILNVSQEVIDIRPACFQTFKDLKHKPFGLDVNNMTLDNFIEAIAQVPKEKRHDLVFENVQARQRTFILMSKGFVLGTGDMSELALGWCTYNGDHMSMYNVNASIPKTLVKFLVRYVAQYYYPSGDAQDILLSIANTTISPELLPAGKDGEIEQSTESHLGPYELHDFFLFNFVRNGFSPEKILFLCGQSELALGYSHEKIVATLHIFMKRFFGQQFKRSCMPDGPKVGSVSLSPRGDWRMPSDADVSVWLKEIE